MRFGAVGGAKPLRGILIPSNSERFEQTLFISSKPCLFRATTQNFEHVSLYSNRHCLGKND